MAENEITQVMSRRGYELATDVYHRRTTRKQAIDTLVSETDMNRGSAADFIANFRHMRRGEEYHRTLNLFTTTYFLDRVRQEFGLHAFKTALSALQKHLDYYDALGKGRQPKLRELLQKSMDSAHLEQDLIDKAGPPHDAPQASDLAEAPRRVATTISRIVRDTVLANRVKALHNYECQICGHTITLADGSRYAEGHHVRPLGAPHDGPDVLGNILCLCPNHHAACDLGAISLDSQKLRWNEAHQMDQKFIEYHNLTIFGH